MVSVAADLAVAVLACLAVKLMDDTLDRERDLAAGRANWAERLRGGATAYAVAALAVAAALNGPLTAALCLGAYASGMGLHGSRLPLGLRAWQESLLALGLAWWLAGWHLALGGILLALAVRVGDDLLDGDRPVTAEAALFGLAAALVSLVLLPASTCGVLGAAAVICWLTRSG